MDTIRCTARAAPKLKTQNKNEFFSVEKFLFMHTRLYTTRWDLLTVCIQGVLAGPRTNLLLPRHQQYAYQADSKFPHLLWYSCTNNYKFIYEPRNNNIYLSRSMHDVQLVY